MKPTVIGLSNESKLVRGISSAMKVSPTIVRAKKYAAGEWTVFTPASVSSHAIVVGNVWEDPVKNFQLFLLLHAVREAGAKTVTLIAPWIAYGRQDRPVHPGEMSAGRVIADTILASGVDEIVTLDAHSPRFIKFFRGRLINVLPTAEIVRTARKHRISAVASPDIGATDRAASVSKLLKCPLIKIGKKRTGPGKVVSRLISGDPTDRRVLLVDDMVDSGATLFNAARTLRSSGASSVGAYVSHAMDLGWIRKRARRGGLDFLEAAFDHGTGKLSVPFSFFAKTPLT